MHLALADARRYERVGRSHPRSPHILGTLGVGSDVKTVGLGLLEYALGRGVAPHPDIRRGPVERPSRLPGTHFPPLMQKKATNSPPPIRRKSPKLAEIGRNFLRKRSTWGRPLPPRFPLARPRKSYIVQPGRPLYYTGGPIPAGRLAAGRRRGRRIVGIPSSPVGRGKIDN